ncbi:MAG: hypothetical protein GTO55_02955 [Armatimonadetes bacterium]|nr:hypothetical protein [Armatimonadota bacterium]NIM23235.1 hypothetical protein [Armatimonadota bacterium]NIM67103.1 hypothetical protein [Armatimonadota bacterium]NIM75630.1 hypothetical protein [Armatimonadota bacterium]NIN05292.1 hypothetical protein [Armatimonadota bacterium]
MENWIWIVIGVVFFWFMMRHGGCCGGHGKHGGKEDANGKKEHDHASMETKETEQGGSSKAGCH